eukprot:Rhum_TRINITY_DN5461_c0_g1::Rhum_TRINITY_DN5461_c0_g1_i1::g.17453::m.17453
MGVGVRYDMRERMHDSELCPDEQLWPFLEEKKPLVAKSVEEFVQTVMFGNHRDTITVLPNGITLMNQHKALPEGLVSALRQSTRVSHVLQRLPEDFAENTKGRLWQYITKGRETEIKNTAKTDNLSAVRDHLTDGHEAGELDVNAPLYLSELRYTHKVEHPITSEMVKTATRADIFDAIPQVALAPLWERSEGGIFVGERGAGSGLHVDQCLWSNIGRQWYGHKLVALWPWEERISILEDAGKGSIFHLPLTENEVSMLKRASVIALLKPGDVFVFSGGVPHMAMCVGDDLNVCAYESFVPLNHKSVARLALSNSKDHFKKCWMDDDDLDELLEDVVDSLVGNVEDPNIDSSTKSELELCEEAMKSHGDSYCRRLWRRVDARRRRAQLNPVVDRNATPVEPSSQHQKRQRLR